MKCPNCPRFYSIDPDHERCLSCNAVLKPSPKFALGPGTHYTNHPGKVHYTPGDPGFDELFIRVS